MNFKTPNAFYSPREFIKKGLFRSPSLKIPSNPISYIHSIIYGRNEYSPKVKQILSVLGD